MTRSPTAVWKATVTRTPTTPKSPGAPGAMRALPGNREHQEQPVEEDDRVERLPQLLSRQAPGERIRELEGPHKAEREPGEQNDPRCEEQDPVGLARFDRLRRARDGRRADAELLRRVLDAVVVRVDPDAEGLSADEPDRKKPEEEPVGKPAGDQPSPVSQLTLERFEPGIRAGHPLPGRRRQLVRALHQRGHARTDGGPRLSDPQILGGMEASA